jgi:hypothetical protein
MSVAIDRTHRPLLPFRVQASLMGVASPDGFDPPIRHAGRGEYVGSERFSVPPPANECLGRRVDSWCSS